MIEAVNDGDFRLSQEILNEIFPEIYDIIKKTYKMNQKSKPEILNRALKVEEKVQNKIEGVEEEQMRKEEEMRKQEEIKKEPLPETISEPATTEFKTEPARIIDATMPTVSQ